MTSPAILKAHTTCSNDINVMKTAGGTTLDVTVAKLASATGMLDTESMAAARLKYSNNSDPFHSTLPTSRVIEDKLDYDDTKETMKTIQQMVGTRTDVPEFDFLKGFVSVMTQRLSTEG